MILEASGIAFSYGGNVVLTDVAFQVGETDHVAVVGYNGCGKTTLLNIITGELEASAGVVVLKNGATLGYLKQADGLDPKNTVYDEMKTVNNADSLLARMKELERLMARDPSLIEEYERVSAKYDAVDGYNMSFNIRRILSGMAFAPDSHDKKVAVLSGGEKTRLALAKLLFMNPDLLVLDEPTNHLDIDTLEWLEQFLTSYKGAIVVVSHDRFFLDKIATKTMEILNGKSKLYSGNFSAHLTQKELADTRDDEVRKRTHAKAEELREYAERNIARASTSKMAKSRLKMLDRLDLSESETKDHVKVKFTVEPDSDPYKEVIVAKELCVAAGGKVLIDSLDLTIMRGRHLAVIGANGTGKTTLLKTLLGTIPPKSGRLRMGGGVKLSYLEQNLFGIKSQNPLEYIRDLYPAMTQFEIRSLLASVGFRGDDVFTSAKGLSGGELARLNLARISLEHPNLLILDEPTNHLDIYTKDLMCEALEGYKGTMIVVTHDRHLIESLDCGILFLDGKKAQYYESYKHYRLNKESAAEPAPPDENLDGRTTQVLPEFKKPQSSKEQRQERAKERERKSYLEKRISELEDDIAFLESETQKPEVASDHERLAEICEILDSEKEELALVSDEWLQNHAD